MHLLIANNIYPPIMAGGAELIVSFLCEELVRRGHRVTVISTCGPKMEPFPIENRNGVEVIRFFPKNLYWSFDRAAAGRSNKLSAAVDSARWHLTDAWNRDAGRRLATIMTTMQPDLLHTHLIDGISATVWRRAKQRGLPVVHTAHDYHLLCPRAFMLSRSWRNCTRPSVACKTYRAWHIHTTSDVDLFVSPSRFLLELHAEAGLRSKASAVTGNGIPLPRGRRRARVGPRNRFVLLARLTPEKGVRVVVNAMRQLPPDLGVELTIAGRGPLEAEVRAAAAADPRINFAGYVQGQDKEKLLEEADHLLLPSLWYENAPVVILEAAAYGLTLIGSRIGGIPEFVREGKTGLLFPPGDATALAQSMIAAMNDTAMLKTLPENGAALAEEFSVSRMTNAYLGHYHRLVSCAKAA